MAKEQMKPSLGFMRLRERQLGETLIEPTPAFGIDIEHIEAIRFASRHTHKRRLPRRPPSILEPMLNKWPLVLIAGKAGQLGKVHM